MPGLELGSVTDNGAYCLAGKEGNENTTGFGVVRALKHAVQGILGAHGRGFFPGLGVREGCSAGSDIQTKIWRMIRSWPGKWQRRAVS